MAKRVLIIGAGAVGSVTAQKCGQFPEVFASICIASRTLKKCDDIKARMSSHPDVTTAKVDADNTAEVVKLIKSFKPDLLINVALPYQNLTIMDACLETKTDYMDTACYEPLDNNRYSYSWQWAYHDRFEKAGIMALTGCGFDPGVTNVFCAYAQKHLFDQIDYLDILDCNAGDHGLPFATNFNPEINLRELDAPGKYYENGQWIEIPAMSKKRDFDFPEAGEKDLYLIYHEELETITKHIPGIKRARFWMTFSENYLTHLRVLKNVGLTRIDPIDFEGQKIVPIQFLKALLPDPLSLGPKTKGKTNIGVVFDGHKNNQHKRAYIYQVCDHQETYKEVGMQAVAYTAGVPPVIGAELMLNGKWRKPGVINCEQLDPDPFMEIMAKYGLPWQHTDDAAFESKV
jgi:saccharopine dehydrogenase (NAD+, L-lysine forming)